MKAVVVAVVAAALVGAFWLGQHPEVVHRVAPGLGSGGSATSTGESLKAADVHKCKSPAGVVYVDHACPPGSRELTVGGGTVTVVSFPKPPPAPASAARIVEGMSPEEIDRMRERIIDQATK
jgi:hypothetical protein